MDDYSLLSSLHTFAYCSLEKTVNWQLHIKKIYIQLVCTVGTYCTAKTIGVVLTSLNIHKEYSGSSWICVGFWFLCFPLPVIIPPLLSTLMSLHTAVYSNVLQAKLLCFCSLYGESECAYFSQ